VPAGAAADPSSNALGLQQQEGQKNVYSFRNNGPAQQPGEPKFFNPADAEANKAGEAKQLLAKVEEKLVKDAKPGEFRGRQVAANGQDKGGGAQGGGDAKAPQTDTQQPPQQFQRKIIRTGEVEYEIESFDTSVLTITKLVEEQAGFIATVNSDKLPNGKVRGVVVVRIPPERLDTLLPMLRGLGELKSQNIRSQDVGKQYYDLESRLRAARTMEERLLKIIKEGKGEIKDLLLAEKELGEWRTKIESYEGEKRYYDSQIGMSTLTVTLNEKEIRSASAVTETERVQMGVEVEDVEKTHKAVLAAVAEAKGRVTKTELKQLAAGQFSALVNFEVSPDAAGPLRDRLKQLGNVARLDIDRVQETEGGIKVLEALKVRQKDTQFFVSIYNLANVTPRETVVMSLACTDAEASYKQILARIEKAGGRVVTSSLNRQKNDQTTGQLRFEIKSAEAEAVLLDIRSAGEVMRLDVTENPDTQAVTKSKKGFMVQLSAMGLVEPRETTTITIASKDVPAAFRALQDALAAAQARVSTAQLNENDRQNVSAMLYFDYRRENDPKILAALSAAGEVLTRSSVRSQDGDRTVDSKKRLNLTVINLSTIPPREIYTLAIEVLTSEMKGRIVDSRHTRGNAGRSVSRITIDLPLSATRGAADKIKALGMLRVFDTTRNPQAPEGDLAIGRIDVTLSNPSQLVDADSGPWMRIKSGLSVGFTALSWSLTLVVVGLCFVVPVGAILWVAMRLYRRMKAKPA
jgi:glycine cleavage system regulatory protein